MRKLSLVVLTAVVGSVLCLTAPASAASAPLQKVFEYRHTYDQFNFQGSIDQSMSSPAIGDVTGDGKADVVVGGMDGTLTVLDSTNGGGGTVLRYVVPVDGGMIQSSPALYDISGDGVLDVIVGVVKRRPAGASRVVGYSFRDSAPGGVQKIFEKADSGMSPDAGFFGSPVIGDVDGDGGPDIIAIGLDQRLHAWRTDGANLPGFPVYTYDTSLSSPALADIDGDGMKEIIVGADMDFGQPLAPGGYLWAVNGNNGSNVPGYPLHVSGEVLWSSPAVGDINGDGRLDIVVGTGHNFGHAQARNLYAIDAGTRAALPGWPKVLDGTTMASPALVNLDGDSALEVITQTSNGKLWALEGNGAIMWVTCAMNFSNCSTDYPVISSPVVANIDSDAGLEVVVSGEREMRTFDAGTGASETRMPTLSASAQNYAHPGAAAPAVGVVGGNTIIAVHVLLETGGGGRSVGDQQGVYVWSAPGASTSLPWGQFHRNASRTGSWDDPRPPVDYSPYVAAVYQTLLGRPPDPGGSSYWVGRLRSGMSRFELTNAISRTPEWIGHVVDGLYVDVFGRAADPSGRAYWSNRILGGARVADVAASLFGSAEYYKKAGGTNGGYVDALYRGILGRAPDSGGLGYWVAELDRLRPREDLSRSLFLSYESNTSRVNDLYSTILKRAPDGGGRDYWARQLFSVDDIVLAALLASSDEYFYRSIR